MSSGAIHKRLNEQEKERVRTHMADYRYREDWDNLTFVRATMQRVLLLPWDSAWNTILLITGVVLLVCYCSCLDGIVLNKPCWSQGKLILVLEIMWVVDILLTVVSRVVQTVWKEHFRNIQIPMQNFGNRPIWLIVVETISILPLYSTTSTIFFYDARLKVFLNIFRGCLKIIRVVYTFWSSLCSISYKLVSLLLFVFVIRILLCVLLISGIIMYCILSRTHCLDMYDLISDIVALMNSSGSPSRRLFANLWPPIAVAVLIPMYWWLTLYFGLGKMAVYLMMLYHRKLNYLWMRYATMRNLASLQIRKQCSTEIHQYWNIVWTECRGNSGFIADTTVPYSLPLLMDKLPPAMANGIGADIGFQALKHSSLFKEMQLAFLREVSAMFKQRNYLAGQYIFHRKELKDCLVYVSQGTIELLSEEDAETPILSLTAGSVICETNVIFPTKSLVNVKCRTNCQVQVLRRNDLLLLASDFKKCYCTLVTRILNRTDIAKTFKIMQDDVRLRYYPNARSSLAVMWIAKTLYRLMKLEFIKASRDYIYDNIYLERDMDESCYRRLLFNANYIDMLCLKRRAYYDDSVFVRLDGWYFILQPNCFLAYIWEGLIVFLAFIVSVFMPYAVLVSGVVKEESYKVLLLSITMLWIIDLFVRLKISVKTKLGKLETSIDILSYHLLSVTYYFDIFAALPMEIITAMCISDLHIRDIASLNRVFKIWRLANILYKFGQRPSTNSLKMHMFILLLFFIYVIYFVACVLFALQNNENRDFYEVFYESAQILTGHTMVLHESSKNNLVLNVFLSFTSWYIHGLLYMMNLTKGLLYTKLKRQVYLHLYQTDTIMKQTVKTRAYNYIETQIKDNLGASIVQLAKPAQASFMDMPKPMKTSILYHTLSARLSKHPLFKNVLGSWMLKVCSVAKIQVIHPREVLFKSGDITGQMYILIEGRCKVYDCLDQNTQHEGRYIKPGDTINEIEVIFSRPLHRTIVTQTHCRFAVLDYNEMSDIMFRRQMDLGITDTMQKIVNEPYLKLAHNYACQKLHVNQQIDQLKNRSFIHHPFNSEYHLRLYKEMGVFGSIIKNIMMNTTIIPNGPFLYRWEVIRSTGLLISTVVFINPESFYSSHASHRLFSFMLFFDMWTFVDIYIRFHIGYFNENGILISHPLLTARYYLMHAFFIDLLPLLPIRYLVKWETFPQIVLFCHFVHLLQLYRYWYFIHAIDVASIKKSKLIKGLPLLFIMFIVGCTVLLHSDCTIHKETWTDVYFDCKNTSLFNNNFVLTSNRQFTATFMYSLYVVTSLLTQCNLHGFTIKSYFDVVFVTIGSIFGLIVRMIMFSFVALHYYSNNASHTISDIDHSNQLKKFMKAEQLSTALSNAILTHYNSARLMPINIHKSTEYLLTSIRRDVLFDNFAPRILAANFLNGVKNADVFLRNILPHMTRSFVNKGLYLLRVNDVVSDIWLVFDGVVKVMAPDDRTHVTYLGPGSLVGNLNDGRFCRIQHMFYAETMLETYTIPSDVFYQYLQYFPEVKNDYNQLKLIFRNFIKTNVVKLQLKVETIQISKNYYIRWKGLVIPATKPWYIYFTIFSGTFVYLDMLVVIFNSSHQAQTLIYIHEIVTLIYIINLIILLKVDFKPYSCELIHKKTCISLKKKWFVISLWIFAAIPLQSMHIMWTRTSEQFAWTIFICNIKLIRLTWIKYMMYHYGAIMGIYISVFKHLYNAGIFVLIIVVAAEFFIVAGFIKSPNMSPSILSSQHSFSMYIQYVLVWIEFASNVLTHSTQDAFYPVDSYFVLACTVLMILFLVASVFFVVDIVFTQLECDMRKAQDAQNLYQLEYFMQAWEVNEYMVTRVKRYIHERYICEAKLKTPPAALQSAPLQLQVSLMDACYGELLEINPVFSHCHVHFLRQLSNYFEAFCYYPEDYIQYQGSMESIMYFVHRGVVEELSEHDVDGCKRHRYITKAQTFGEIQGLNINSPLRHSYRAATPSVVLSLKYSSWAHMLDLFPASRAIINMQLTKFMRIHKEAQYHEIII